MARLFMLYDRQSLDARKDAAHNKTNNKNSYKHNKLVMDLKHLQAQQEDILIEDRVLFSQYPENTKTMKTYQLQKLIRTIVPIVPQSKHKAKKLGKQQCKLASYYKPQKRWVQLWSQIPIPFPTPKQSPIF